MLVGIQKAGVEIDGRQLNADGHRDEDAGVAREVGPQKIQPRAKVVRGGVLGHTISGLARGSAAPHAEATSVLVFRMNTIVTQSTEGPTGVRLLVFSLLALCVLSVPVFCTQFLNDMDSYALVSNKLLHGAVLYRNAIDTKPPLVFLHYAAIFRLVGSVNLTAVKIVTMIWLGLTAFVTSRIYKALFPSSRRPEVAALLFILASFSGWGEDFLSSNTEILSNLFVLLGVWCMVAEDFSDSAVRLVLGGLMIGIACLYRNQAGAVLAAYGATVIVRHRDLPRMTRRFFFLGVGWLVPVAIVIAYYVSIDSLPDLVFLLRYQSYYLRRHDQYAPQVLGQVAIVLVSQAPFLLLSGWQVIRLMRGRLLTRDVFLLWFLGFSVLPFFIGGHYFAHYFVQAIPALVLLATEALASPAARPDGGRGTRFFRCARAYVAINVVLFSAVNTFYYSQVQPDAPNPALARFIQQYTTPDDSLFLWTWRRNVLFEVHRVYATRFLSNEFLTGRLYGTAHRLPTATPESVGTAAVAELWPVLLRDLRAERPRVIIDDAPGQSRFTLDRYPALSMFVQENYEPCRLMDGLCVYLRKAA